MRTYTTETIKSSSCTSGEKDTIRRKPPRCQKFLDFPVGTSKSLPKKDWFKLLQDVHPGEQEQTYRLEQIDQQTDRQTDRLFYSLPNCKCNNHKNESILSINKNY